MQAELIHLEEEKEAPKFVWKIVLTHKQEAPRKTTTDRARSTAIFLFFLAAFFWSVKLYYGL